MSEYTDRDYAACARAEDIAARFPVTLATLARAEQSPKSDLDRCRDMLNEAALQIEYMRETKGGAGTGATIVARIRELVRDIEPRR